MVPAGSSSVRVSGVQQTLHSHSTAGARDAEGGDPSAELRAEVHVPQPRGEGTAQRGAAVSTLKDEGENGGAERSKLGSIEWIAVQRSADVFLRFGCMHHMFSWQARLQRHAKRSIAPRTMYIKDKKKECLVEGKLSSVYGPPHLDAWEVFMHGHHYFVLVQTNVEAVPEPVQRGALLLAARCSAARAAGVCALPLQAQVPQR